MVVLEFDHQHDKKFTIGDKGHRHTVADLIAEMAKCEVRCANCHRKRHNDKRSFKTWTDEEIQIARELVAKYEGAWFPAKKKAVDIHPKT